MSISSIFKDFGDIYDAIRSTNPSIPIKGDRIYLAEVVDVVMSKQHAKYRSDTDIGKIIIRELFRDSNLAESEIKREAYPIDIANMRIPLPGEFVVVMRGLPSDFELGLTIAGRDYYLNVVSNLHLLNYNGVSFGGTLPDKISKTLGAQGLDFIKQLKDRHKTRFNSFIERQIKHLRPYDGDQIIQGRFGNSIRLGSTVSAPGNSNPYGSYNGYILEEALGDLTLSQITENIKLDVSTWSEEGAAGDPIIILRTAKVDNIKYDDKKPSEIFVVEDINQDGSSMYLCENQKIAVELQIANIGFKTWMKDLGIKPVSNTTTVNDTVKQKANSKVGNDGDDTEDTGDGNNEQVIL